MMNKKKNQKANLILASASMSRRAMLHRVGIDCICQAADIDEGAIKDSMLLNKAAPEEISMALAISKAQIISPHYPGGIVLGADQILICDGKLFDKPCDPQEAMDHLRFFRGKTHYLYTSYALVQDGKVLVQKTECPRLTMRDFSKDFLQSYLQKSGDKILSSVGCYLLEDLGPQLFSDISGDYFTILGLPLLNVMENLRELNILEI